MTESTAETRGRKAKTEVVPAAQAMDLVQQEETEKAALAIKFDGMFGSNLPYERTRIMTEIVTLTSIADKSIVEAGKRLLVLKAHEDHGSWLATLEQMQLSPRYVQRAMSTAKAFGKYDNLSHLSQSQFQAISFFSEEEKQDLNDGKDVLGLDVDDISKMTRKEIEAALRKEKSEREKERDAQEEVIAAKNNKLDEMERALRYQQPPTKAQLAQVEIDEIAKKFFLQISSASETIIQATKGIDEIQKLDGVEFEQLTAFGERFNDYVAGLADAYEDFVQAYDYMHVDKSEGDQK